MNINVASTRFRRIHTLSTDRSKIPLRGSVVTLLLLLLIFPIVGMGEPELPRTFSYVVRSDGEGDFVNPQNAISAIPREGGTVFISEGTYTLSSPLEINSRQNIVVIGSGPATVLQVRAPSGINAVEVRHSSGIVISNLMIRGRKDVNPEPTDFTQGNGVMIADSSFCQVSDLRIENAANYGVLLIRTTDSVVRDTFILNPGGGMSGTETGDGINAYRTARCEFTRCRVEGAHWSGIQILYQYEDGIPSGNVVSQCTILGSRCHGAVAYDVSGTTWIGNYVEGLFGDSMGCPGPAMGFLVQAKDTTLQSNTIVGWDRGIWVWHNELSGGSTETRIQGNSISNTTFDCLQVLRDEGHPLEDSSRTMVTGNSFRNCGWNAAVFLRTPGQVITDNEIHHSGRCAIWAHRSGSSLISSNRVFDNSQSRPGVFDGIRVTGVRGDPSYDVIVTGNISTNRDNPIAQRHGVYLGPQTFENIVTSNSCRGNQSSGLIVTNSADQVDNNIF